MSARQPIPDRLYQAAAAAVSRLRLAWKGPERLPRPVLSVGNLAMGGTGKTPVAELLARLLSEEGLIPCILSRGYRGIRDRDPLVVSNLHHLEAGPVSAGDEAFLLARRLPGVPVVVGRNRHAAGLLALEQFPVHVFVLDDGFQHRRLHRDLDLVLLDALRPWKRLREAPSALRRAHAILLTRCQLAGPDAVAARKAELGRIAPGVPLLAASTETTELRRLGRGSGSVPELSGRRVLAFAGLARPQPFFDELEDRGLRTVRCMEFPDHHAYDKADVRRLFHAAQEAGATALITTEKDAVRLPLPGLSQPLPVLALGQRVVLEDPAAFAAIVFERLPPPRIAGRS